MQSNESTKKCVDCYSEIPFQASKCVKCGSYQDWRRFIPAWSGLLALVIAALAFLNSVWGYGRGAVEAVSQHFYERSFDLNAAVVELKADRSTFAVTNLSERSVVLTSIQCSLFLPINPSAFTESAPGEGFIERYRFDETVGMFLVSFDPEEPIQIAASEQVVIKLLTAHVSPAFGAERFDPPKDPKEFVSSFCSITGVRGNNELVGGALLLNKLNTIDVDALEVLQIADYSKQQEPERQSLANKIVKARTDEE